MQGSVTALKLLTLEIFLFQFLKFLSSAIFRCYKLKCEVMLLLTVQFSRSSRFTVNHISIFNLYKFWPQVRDHLEKYVSGIWLSKEENPAILVRFAVPGLFYL